MPGGPGPDFSFWWYVMVIGVAAPTIFLAVKFIAERRRDRRTRELIRESNKEGKVPDLPPDFEPPQVLPRRERTSAARRYR